MLARFEQLLERALEGSVRRVFPTALQPVQLAKAAARAMEEAQVVGLRGPEVPNAYRVQVAAEDFERFASYRATLARELSEYLADYARDRGLRPVGQPRVEIVTSDAVRPGSVRVDARFVDLEPARQAQLEQALEGTRALRIGLGPGGGLDHDKPAAPQLSVAAQVVDRLSGAVFNLDPEEPVVRLGRAEDNDVVLANQRVSRYHAQLRQERGRWVIHDLDSTNGTFVDGERVLGTSGPLEPGAVLRLGDHDLLLRDGKG